MLFKRLDRPAWKDTFYNPMKLLKMLPPEILAAAAGDPEYQQHYKTVHAKFHADMETKRCWFEENITNVECPPIAYFSFEYGLHRSLPFYAGGLGFLAGDHLKECSDLEVPLVAVGFMYPRGYLRQKMREDGWQESVDQILDRDAAPITRVLNEKEEQRLVRVPFIEPPIYVAVWQVTEGTLPKA